MKPVPAQYEDDSRILALDLRVLKQNLRELLERSTEFFDVVPNTIKFSIFTSGQLYTGEKAIEELSSVLNDVSDDLNL